MDDPIIPFEDELFGASLLQKHYLIETEDVKGMSSFYKKLRKLKNGKQWILLFELNIYDISDDEGVDTGGGTSSNESNSPIK